MDRPNILFVFADQHRFSALGSSGDPIIRTPNLDRLASEGIACDQAFSSHPLCSPYRANLLTGTYGWKNGVVDNEYKMWTSPAALPEVLKSAGYHTGFIGKWHLGYGPYTDDMRYGFDYLAAYDCGYGFYKTEYYENEEGPKPWGCWAPEGETSLAIKFLEEHREHREHRQKEPFALMVAWAPPHWPYDEYPEEYRIYDPEKIPLPVNVPEQMAAFARKEIADYYGCITALDYQLGRLLEALEKLGFADETIVCYSSDHGDHLSSHGYGKPFDRWLPPSMRASKSTPYDEAVRVPFLARFPGRINPGSRTNNRTNALLSSVDTMPTLLSLCNLEVPDTVQGKDMSHVFLGKDGPLSDSVYLMNMGPGWPHRGKWTGNWRAVRTDRWVYARWHKKENGPLLFDRKNDPCEMNNLAGAGENLEIENRLEARLEQWMTETGDPFDTGERDPATNMLILGQEFTHEKWKK